MAASSSADPGAQTDSDLLAWYRLRLEKIDRELADNSGSCSASYRRILGRRRRRLTDEIEATEARIAARVEA